MNTMIRFFTTAAYAVLLLALGFLGYWALNGADAAATAASTSTDTHAFVDADESDPVSKYNVIAIPVDARQQFSDAGAPFKASGLATIVGSGVEQVLRWRQDTQTYETYFTAGFGNNFDLDVGGVYRILVDSNSPAIVSFVGDVPPKSTDPGHPIYNLVGSAGTCKFNTIAIPLDRSDIVKAHDVGNAIVGTVQVLQWRADTQTYETYYTAGFGNDFVTNIGYPYRICLDQNAPATWP